MKYKIKRKKALKTKHIFILLIILLLSISTSYAIFTTQLIINGNVSGQRQLLDIFYINISTTSSDQTTIYYMDTYTKTFSNPPSSIEVTMGGTTLTQGTDYTYTNGTLTIPDVTGTLVIRSNLTEYTITYNLNGGAFSGTAVSSYTSATPTFNLPTPTKTGYTFLGWTEGTESQQEAVNASLKLENNVIYNIGTQGNNTLYVRATSGEAYASYVTFNNDPRAMIYVYDTSTTTVEFSTNANFSTKTVISNWETHTENGITIYCQYFTLRNGTKNENSGIPTYDGTFSEFIAALTDTDTTTYYNPYTVTQGSTGNISVAANWKSVKTYTVTFNANGGSGTMSAQTFVEGEAQALKTNTFTRTGRTFKGWSTSRYSTTVTYTNEQVITLNSNIQLYAVWQRN